MSKPVISAADVGQPDDQWLAFEAFVREQHAALCAYAYRYVRARDVAEDVVQEVLLRVWRHRGRIAEADLVPYVYRSVAHGAISRLRSERAARNRDERLAREAEHRRPADHLSAGDDLEGHVRRAIEALPERCRLVFLLSRDSGLTYPAIAERLGISVKTVENQMIRALRHLRTALKPHLLIALALPILG